MNPGTVVVTGCAGFIGSHTTELLLQSGWRVIGADDLSSGTEDNLRECLNHPRFFLETGDFSMGSHADRILCKHRPEAVIHLAGLVNVKAAEDDPIRNQRLNVQMTRLIAQATLRHSVRRIVFASSAAVYGDLPGGRVTDHSEPHPIGNYGKAKLESERLLRDLADGSSLEVVSLRYFNVFGLRQRPESSYAGVLTVFLERFRLGLPVTVFGDGLQTRDFISVTDVSLANLLAITRPVNSILTADICSGKAHSLIEILGFFHRAFPKAPPPIFAPLRINDIQDSCGDPTKAAEALGFRVSTTFEDKFLSMISNSSRATQSC
jgi:UDP-glucose 4-epimerase